MKNNTVCYPSTIWEEKCKLAQYLNIIHINSYTLLLNLPVEQTDSERDKGGGWE